MRNVIFIVLYYTGIAHLLLWKNKRKRKIPIVLFHRISPDPDPAWPPLTPEIFEETIRLLSRYYVFTSLDEILDINTPNPKNGCSIVFDDGFYDFKIYALPVLAKYKVPVTLFVSTDNIENNTPIWTSEIDNILLNTGKLKENTLIDVGNEKVTLKLKSEQNLFDTSASIKNILMRYEIEPRNVIIKKMKEELNVENGFHHPMLSWNDILEMKSKHPGLISIQSHSHTHPFLPSIQINQIEIESKISREVLKSKNLNTIDKMAYPFGGYDSKTIEGVKKFYSFAFKVGNELVDLSQRNTAPDWEYKIPRIIIHDNSPYEILCRINGFHKLLIG